MAFIEIKNLFKRFSKVVAVNRIQLEVNEGEMLTLLGPSGCGKTTTLRCIAGLERPEEGDIVIDGKPMLSEGFVQPSKRGIGMVFQNYAVWPHMKVFNNIVYGLKLQKLPRQKKLFARMTRLQCKPASKTLMARPSKTAGSVHRWVTEPSEWKPP